MDQRNVEMRMVKWWCLMVWLGVASWALAGEPEVVLRGKEVSELAPHGKGNVYAADIVEHDGALWMYYGGQGKDGHDRIHLAISRDDQKSWTREGVVFEAAGVNHVNDPSVMVVKGRFYLFYTRADVGVTDTIGLATSDDGRKWKDQGTVFTARPAPAWDSWLVGRPSVLHDGKKFRMWFDGRSDLPLGAPDLKAPKSAKSQRYVGYAESEDGITWKRQDAYVFDHDAGGVHVCPVKDGYVMLFESHAGTHAAISADGLIWKYRGLLAAKEARSAPHGHVTPFLLNRGEKITLYFGAAPAANWNENYLMRQEIGEEIEKVMRDGE
ncbi:MAG: hypothetical protein ACO1RA_12525 [Planctomycetaceae bacterium]